MKRIVYRIDNIMLGWIVGLLYPRYIRPRYGYLLNIKVIIRYVIWQKVIGINRKVKWPVHFTSVIVAPKRIQKGVMCDPGDTPGCYIQAINGIKFGSNIEMGAGVRIISSNHDEGDYRLSLPCEPIVIGDNVWLGSNVVVLPGVSIGSNVIVGAGSIVTKDIPSNCVAVGNPCRVIRSKEEYVVDYNSIEMNRIC